ncbi:CAP domain-containing protein [Paracoccus albus]|uniref:CAP domain-containing protein n=1 Tax=Paracoccus albus TaxID=3017784 RepID=UPI0022F00E01|nr:CAP domain-containing protein [Paracoccus albus]WBU61799.1 CAP domain-containing protein [Paracoccus albus]
MKLRKVVPPLAVIFAVSGSIFVSQAAFAELVPRPSTTSPRLPSGVVRIQGGGETRISPGGAASCVQTTRAEAEAAVTATNAIRAQRRLKPLSTNLKLQRAAEAHACEMAQRGIMSHRGKGGSGPAARVKRNGFRPRITAENIAAGRFDLNRVIHEWASSRYHLSNIMLRRVTEHGIGHAIGADGKTVFWAAVYASGR